MPTVMDTIVKYSKDCITMRFIKNHLKKSLFLAKRLPIPFRLPSVDSIKIVIDELDLRLNEKENDIGKLLIPLFEKRDFNYDKDGKCSLSIQEIKDGYILLKEVSRRDSETGMVLSYKPEEHVILLRQLYVEKQDLWYSPGVLYKLGAGLTEEDLYKMAPNKEEFLSNDLLSLIIKKKTAYEYLE